MEMLAEKIHLVASHKNNILDIYTVGERVHQVLDQCTGESCNCLSFLQSISDLLMRIEGEETTPEQICCFTGFVLTIKILFYCMIKSTKSLVLKFLI